MQHPSNSNESKKIRFNNALKILVKDPSVSRVDIIKSLASLENFSVKHISVISQMFTNQFWLVTLSDEVEAKNFYDQDIKIKSEVCTIQDPNNFSKHYLFKVMWLPHNFSQRYLIKFFESQKLKIVEIKEEYMREEEFKDIKTGNYIIKVRCEDEKIRIPDSDIYSIEGFKAFISRIGGQPKCLRCKNFGHIRKNCPQKDKPKNLFSQIAGENTSNLPNIDTEEEEIENTLEKNSICEIEQDLNDDIISDYKKSTNSKTRIIGAQKRGNETAENSPNDNERNQRSKINLVEEEYMVETKKIEEEFIRERSENEKQKAK